MPLVAPVAHCIAPDLIGFGQSGKPDIAYRVEDHVRYLDAFIAKAGIGSAYLVVQDWGTGLAFHLAERRPEFVRGLAFMEFVAPVRDLGRVRERLAGARDLPQVPHPRRRRATDPRRECLRRARAAGRDAAQAQRRGNGGLSRALRDASVAAADLAFPNEIPIAGEPADVAAMMERAHAALALSTYPKLLFAADPGALVAPALAEDFARKLKDCRLVKLGDGVHFLQEDHPETIGRAVAAFVAEVEGRAGQSAA